MAILGFMVGALITIILRGLQSLDPIWAAGPGLVMAGFFMAGFFVWGMGAFNPKLSVHGEAEEAVHEELEKEAAQPRSLLLGSTWMIATITLDCRRDPGGSGGDAGRLWHDADDHPRRFDLDGRLHEVPLPFGGPTIEVSTLVIFGVFILIAFLSLVARSLAVRLLSSPLCHAG